MISALLTVYIPQLSLKLNGKYNNLSTNKFIICFLFIHFSRINLSPRAVEVTNEMVSNDYWLYRSSTLTHLRCCVGSGGQLTVNLLYLGFQIISSYLLNVHQEAISNLPILLASHRNFISIFVLLFQRQKIILQRNKIDKSQQRTQKWLSQTCRPFAPLF